MGHTRVFSLLVILKKSLFCFEESPKKEKAPKLPSTIGCSRGFCFDQCGQSAGDPIACHMRRSRYKCRHE